MQVTPSLKVRNSRVVVVDDCLPEDLWDSVLNSVHHELMKPWNVVGEYDRVWRYEGILPASSVSYLHSKGPYDTYPGVMGQFFLSLASRFPDLVTPGWGDLRIHSHICNRGTKLNWHIDGHCHAALTYYPHKRWESTWGGELFVPELPPQKKPKRTYNNNWENEVLKDGIGIYITPKPNRCVITAPGVLHQVTRIDPDAGDAVRVSIVGFLMAPDVEKEEPMPQSFSLRTMG